MLKTLNPTTAAVAAALCLGVSLPSLAVEAPVGNDQPDLVLDVQAGDVLWKRPSNFNAQMASPDGTIAGTFFRVNDAGLGVPGVNLRTDPLDDHLAIAVNGTPFIQASGFVDRITTATGTQLNTTTRVVTGGITTSLDYFFSNSQNAARAFGRFTNDTGSSQTVRVLFGGGLGSDGGTTIEATSSGDTELQAADDLWLINSDRLGANRDPVQVFSFAVQGGLMPDFSVWGNLTGAQWTFELAAGETKNLMWFNQLHFDLASAQAAVGTFANLNSLQAAGLLEGLSATDLALTANWNAAPIPEPGTWALALAGLLAVHRQVKRQRPVRTV